MQIVTVFDEKFRRFAASFYHSLRHYNKTVPVTAYINKKDRKACELAKSMSMDYKTISFTDNLSKVAISRILKMRSVSGITGPAVYMDIDVIFQGDIAEIEDLNPQFIWILSRRRGSRKTVLRKWLKQYFRREPPNWSSKWNYSNIRKLLNSLTDGKYDPDFVLNQIIRNCGLVYSDASILHDLFSKAEQYYLRMLDINRQGPCFMEKDQLCFLLAFLEFDNIRELPARFNRMPQHQSYEFKNINALFIPDTIVVHLNRCERLAEPLVQAWTHNEIPQITPSRDIIVLPNIQRNEPGSIKLKCEFYELMVQEKATIYKDDDVGFILQELVDGPVKKDILANNILHGRAGRAFFFLFNGLLFMVDTRGCDWQLGQSINSLHGIFGLFPIKDPSSLKCCSFDISDLSSTDQINSIYSHCKNISGNNAGKNINRE